METHGTTVPTTKTEPNFPGVTWRLDSIRETSRHLCVIVGTTQEQEPYGRGVFDCPGSHPGSRHTVDSSFRTETESRCGGSEWRGGPSGVGGGGGQKKSKAKVNRRRDPNWKDCVQRVQTYGDKSRD